MDFMGTVLREKTGESISSEYSGGKLSANVAK